MESVKPTPLCSSVSFEEIRRIKKIKEKEKFFKQTRTELIERAKSNNIPINNDEIEKEVERLFLDYEKGIMTTDSDLQQLVKPRKELHPYLENVLWALFGIFKWGCIIGVFYLMLFTIF